MLSKLIQQPAYNFATLNENRLTLELLVEKLQNNGVLEILSACDRGGCSSGVKEKRSVISSLVFGQG